MDLINENWTEPVGDEIDVPDILMPLFNKVGMQIRFYTISGKNEVMTIAHIVENSRRFFRDNPAALGIEAKQVEGIIPERVAAIYDEPTTNNQ